MIKGRLKMSKLRQVYMSCKCAYCLFTTTKQICIKQYLKTLTLLQTFLMHRELCSNLSLSFNKLSQLKDVQNTFQGAVNYLDLENCEYRYLLSGCSDGSIYIHDLRNPCGVHQFSAQCIATLRRGERSQSVQCVSWYPSDNRLFVSSGNDCKLTLWDTNSKQILESFRTKGRVFRHAWCLQHQNLIAVASLANVVDLVDIRTGNISHELRGHKDSVTNVAWSPRCPEALVTGGRDSRVFMWDVRSAMGPVYQLDWNSNGSAHSGPINSLSFTPDGLHVVTFGSDRRVRLWETSLGKSLAVNYEELSNKTQKPVQMSVGRNVIFMPNKGRISVLNLWTGENEGHLWGHFNTVMCCVFREDYQELYSGGTDHNLHIWTAEELTCPSDDEADILEADAWSSDEG